MKDRPGVGERGIQTGTRRPTGGGGWGFSIIQVRNERSAGELEKRWKYAKYLGTAADTPWRLRKEEEPGTTWAGGG